MCKGYLLTELCTFVEINMHNWALPPPEFAPEYMDRDQENRNAKIDGIDREKYGQIEE